MFAERGAKRDSKLPIEEKAWRAQAKLDKKKRALAPADAAVRQRSDALEAVKSSYAKAELKAAGSRGGFVFGADLRYRCCRQSRRPSVWLCR
mgnify:CR=1 FL=1